jgi:MazG-like family
MLKGGNMDIRSGQKLAWENKVTKGFNLTNVPLEFCLLQGEMAEAFDAWRKGREDVGEELADVAIYLLGLAEMTGIDLQHEIEAKMAKNAARVYHRLPSGALAKSSGEPE